MVPEEAEELRVALEGRLGESVLMISGVTGKGVDALLEQLWSALQQ
jgi:hypothetical protein